MLAVELNRANYEYDVNSIVKAFYPEEQVSVLTPEMRAEKRESLEPDIRIRIFLKPEGAVIWMDGEERCWDARDVSVQGRDILTGKNAAEEAEEDEDAGADMEPGMEKEYKYGFKCFLYRVLSQVTGKELPWGNLTGIRPTKIAFQLLEEGKSGQEIVEHYRQRYFVSTEKAELAVDIARRERGLLDAVSHGKKGEGDGMDHAGERSGEHAGRHREGCVDRSGCVDSRDCGYSQDCGYSLYIGIPFCPTTCLYCSFTSFPISSYRKLVDAYVDCLIRELEYVAEWGRDKILDTVYIGGGTPTTLEPEQMDRLLRRIRSSFDFSMVQEFTVEAGRADSITEEKLEALRQHGVSRISINPQTMNQETLDYIGRKASVEQVEQAYALARRMGFDNINMDLILGLPGEGEPAVQHTIDKVVEMAPDSLTVHSLAVKRASRLSQLVQERGTGMLRNTDETMRIAAEGAKHLGLLPYYLYRQKNMSGNFENVGYAREGKFGLYNILIMEEKQSIVACGAGSISKRVCPDGRIERCENVKDVSQYIERIGEMIERKRVLLDDLDLLPRGGRELQ